MEIKMMWSPNYLSSVNPLFLTFFKKHQIKEQTSTKGFSLSLLRILSLIHDVPRMLVEMVVMASDRAILTAEVQAIAIQIVSHRNGI